MSAGKALYNILSNDAGVIALVGTRIYPVIATQSATGPYVVYSEIVTNPSDTKTGVSKLDQVRVQIDIYSATYTVGESIEVAIRTALDRASGTYNGVQVNSIQYITSSNGYEEDTSLFRKTTDYYLRIIKA